MNPEIDESDAFHKVLQRWAKRKPNAEALIYLDDGRTESHRLTYGELDVQLRLLAANLQQDVPPGAQVLIALPQGLDFALLVLACLYAGVVAVPLYPPQSGRARNRFDVIAANAKPRLVVTGTSITMPAAAESGSAAMWRSVNQLQRAGFQWREPVHGRDQAAIVQYTSGSTFDPKGIVLTHSNVIWGAEVIRRACGHDERSTFVSWLPLFHDMGLFGNLLQPLFVGATAVLMPPQAFLQEPARWLHAISRYGASTSGGPNFAYELCIHRIDEAQAAGLDLRRWQVAFIGAEPVRARTLRRFAERFERHGFRRTSLFPCYGLAEATLLVSGGHSTASNDGVVSCGPVSGLLEAAIVDPQTLVCEPDGRVGEIWVAGASIARHYHNQTPSTQGGLDARLHGRGGWLRTGDLGYLREGELYVTGRLKDLIVINGANHHPQDIESTVEQSDEAILPGGCAAFSFDAGDEERLVVVAELQRSRMRGDLSVTFMAACEAVLAEHGLSLTQLLLVRPGAIPRTSSGKVQRSACRQAVLDGTLHSLVPFGATPAARAPDGPSRGPASGALAQWLAAEAAAVLGIQLEPGLADKPLVTLGLSSISAVQLAHRLHARTGVAVPVSRILGRCSVRELAQEIASHPVALGPPRQAASAGGDRRVFALSAGQRTLWLRHQAAGRRQAPSIVRAFEIRGLLDEGTLQRALEAVVDRHGALRTTFPVVDGEPRQCVHRRILITIGKERRTGSAASSIEAEIGREEEAGFDLERGPLLRVSIVEFDDRCILLMAVHHIVVDLWSLAVIFAELRLIYGELRGGAFVGDWPLPVQYAAFVEWQAALQQGPHASAALDHWLREASPAVPRLSWPAGEQRRQPPSSETAVCTFAVDPAALGVLRGHAAERQATLFMALLTIFQVVLHHHAGGQASFSVGVPFAGRDDPAFTGVVGYLVNMLPLRCDCAGDPRYGQMLKQTRRRVLASADVQGVPVDERAFHGDTTPQVVFVLQEPHLQGSEVLAGIAVGAAGLDIDFGAAVLRSLENRHSNLPFDLTLTCACGADGLRARFDYRKSAFSPAQIEALARGFANITEAFVRHPDPRLSELGLIFRGTPAPTLLPPTAGQTGPGRTLHELFEAQVVRTPLAVAVVDGEDAISYREINERADALARALRRHGVGPEVIVALCLQRSWRQIVAIVATLKAGGAYLPLDPDWPAQRLSSLLHDSRAQVVVTEASLATDLESLHPRVLRIEAVLGAASENSVPQGDAGRASAANLAYVIYTSGSTGEPKGVMVTHAQAVRLFERTCAHFGFGSRDVWTLFHAYTFDFSVWELWGALLHGGRLIVVSYWDSRTPEAFYRLLCTQRVTVLNHTPSAFRQLDGVEHRAGRNPALCLRLVIFGGEALDAGALAGWFERHGPDTPRMVNMYGITETTVHATAHVVIPGEAQGENRGLIGRALDDLEVHVLDRYQQPVAVASPGEIYVGGAGVSRGYLHRPRLTAERFVPHPFSEKAGERLYRSGDLGQYTAAGELSYLGRIDDQVKLRGFRIEPAEIESALHRHPAIERAAVLIQDVEGGQRVAEPDPIAAESAHGGQELRRFRKAGAETQELVAYLMVRSGETVTENDLRQSLGVRLPSYMLPAKFLLVDDFPLTPHGKLHRQALRSVGSTRLGSSGRFVEPDTPEAKLLARIWCDVLGVPSIGLEDQFFDRGGDSIKAIQIRARAAEAGIDFQIEDLFEHQTIGCLLDRLRQGASVRAPSALRADLVLRSERDRLPAGIEDAYPLAGIQAGMIFHAQANPDSAIYHDIFFYKLRGAFDDATWRRAVRGIVARHAVLRTSFDLTTYSIPLQLVHSTVELPLEVQDHRALAPEAQALQQRTWLAEEKRHRFDWERAPLIRFFLQRTTDETCRLVLSFHDLILDGWSVASLVTELLTEYDELLSGRASSFKAMHCSYRDFIAAEQEAIRSPACRGFWKELLHGHAVTNMPYLRPAGTARPDAMIEVTEVRIPSNVSQGIHRVARLHGVSVKHVLLAVHLKALAVHGRTSDVLTGLESNGRLELEDGHRVLGMHLNTTPFRLRIRPGTWSDLIREVFRAERVLLPHRRYPLGHMPHRVGEAMFESVFNYTHFHVFSKLDRLAQLQVVDAYGFGETHFGLRVEFNRDPISDEIKLDLEVDANRFLPGGIERLGAVYESLLESVTTDPGAHHQAAPLSVPWPAAGADLEVPGEGRIDELIEAAGARWGDRLAVVCGDGCLSYAQLLERVRGLSGRLREAGVGPEVVVGLLMQRSVEMVVGVLAVLKAGGAYLALDAEHPAHRIGMIVRQAAAAVVLTDAASEQKWTEVSESFEPAGPGMWRTAARDAAGPEAALAQAGLENLAYVIYTSGSSGQPKGVQVSHRNLLNSTWARTVYYKEPVGAFLWVSPLAFDSSVAGLFWTLLQGGTLVVPQEGEQREPLRLLALIHRYRVSHLLGIGSLYAGLLEQPEMAQQGASLRVVMVAGEACLGEWVKRHEQVLPGARMFNEYGPTEASVWSSVHECRGEQAGKVVSIGHAIANTQLYVLDEWQQPVPWGVVGELYIGGEGVARGYLGSPGGSAQAFVPDGFSGRGGARLYRTGDLVRQEDDGSLTFLGRRDEQVKVRGYRVDVAEIEAVLQAQAGVAAAAVVARAAPGAQATGGQKVLVAYVVREQPMQQAQLKAQLAMELPAYMQPSAIHFLQELPRTANGKTDRRALIARQDHATDIESLLQYIERLSHEQANALLGRWRANATGATPAPQPPAADQFSSFENHPHDQ